MEDSSKYKIIKTNESHSSSRMYDVDDVEDMAKKSRFLKKKRQLDNAELDIDDDSHVPIHERGERSYIQEDDGNIIEPLNMKNEIREGLIDSSGIYQLQSSEKKKKQKKSLLEDFGSDSDEDDDEWFKSVAEMGEKGITSKANENLDKKPDIVDSPFEAFQQLYDILEENERVSDALIKYRPIKKNHHSKKKQKQNLAFQEITGEPNQRLFDRITDLSSYLLGHGHFDINMLSREEILTKMEKIKGKKAVSKDVRWEYKWSEDSNEVHGPFDAVKMEEWRTVFSQYESMVVRKENQSDWIPFTEVSSFMS